MPASDPSAFEFLSGEAEQDYILGSWTLKNDLWDLKGQHLILISLLLTRYSSLAYKQGSSLALLDCLYAS